MVNLKVSDRVDRLMEASPQGFKSTILDEDKLRKLESAPVDEMLGNVVLEYGSKSILDKDIIHKQAVEVLDGYLLPETTFEIPGLAMAMQNDHLKKFAANYLQDNDTPSGTIKPPELASSGDIVFTFADPEVWGQIQNVGAGSAVPNFQQTGLTAGSTLDLVADAGIDETSSTAGNVLSLDDDEWLFYTGDVIDLSGNAVITKLQLATVDGESDFGPSLHTMSERAGEANILTAQGSPVETEIDLDAKVYASGDAEAMPVVFYMASGSKAQSLV